MSRISRLMFLAFTALMTIGYGACAGLVDVTGTYEPLQSGYRYHFRVHNLTDAQLNLHVAQFAVLLDGWPYTDIVSPPLWECRAQTFHVKWSTSDTPSGTWDEGIAPGEILYGFSFTSERLVASMSYFAWLSNGTDTGGDGDSLAPVLVPEPSGLLPLCGAMLALGLPWVRRRRR